MRRFHLVFGAVLLVAFVLTGQYMDKVQGHLAGMADGPRLLYRSRHIYVLLTALVNLALGAHARDAPRWQSRAIQLTGSAAVAGASAAMVVAFFYDTPHANFEHLNLWWSRAAIYSLVAGVALHVIGGTLSQQPNPAASAERATL